VPTPEHKRLKSAHDETEDWKRWGPYVSERSWGTVREDYSENGSTWDHISYWSARSRAYRWSEDGIGGVCDRDQTLCLAFAFWNENDPILKERLFGLSGTEGNHAEDVKEYYYYLDSTPTHSYMKFLYKYPQAAFPYKELLEENQSRSARQPEYELIQTGVFDDDRYFDIFIEYVKAAPDDLLLRLSIHNRGSDSALLHVLPHLWFRNTWSWFKPRPQAPEIEVGESDRSSKCLVARHGVLGERRLYCGGHPDLLFTDNETNEPLLYETPARPGEFYKDAFHEAVVEGRREALRTDSQGTKAAAHYRLEISPGASEMIELRLSGGQISRPFQQLQSLLVKRRGEADAFYDSIHPPSASKDEKRVQRQALAGLLWTKQYYHYHIGQWLDGDLIPPPKGRELRNEHWRHFYARDVMSMPDKWEYPWFAAWDLSFQCLPFTLVDLDFSKQQMELMVAERFLHPNGDTAAYEWEFSDANPPVESWATWRIYKKEKELRGKGDLSFLRRMFHRLMLNFTFWVNRKDADDNNVFEGGFLGLDNISVFDRSKPMPGGSSLDQADGTAWMGIYALTMMNIALELAEHEPDYNDMAVKFFHHFIFIADAMRNIGMENRPLWDEEDGFFYDVLLGPNGQSDPVRVRSVAGLIPLAAVATLDDDKLERCPEFKAYIDRFFIEHPHLMGRTVEYLCQERGHCSRLLCIVGIERLKRILKRLLDEDEFLSEYGLRSLSKFHKAHPFSYGNDRAVAYEPAESHTRIKGGNSNWRGPIWFPTGFLVIQALYKYHEFMGDRLKVECPTGSGNEMTLDKVADELARRMIRLFIRDGHGHRPVFGGAKRFQQDPHWKDYILFYEYFHGDNGAGIGASHQTGWTALVAKLIQDVHRDSIS